MRERLLSIIRPKGKESRETGSPYGYMQIGDKRIDIKNPFIYAGSTQKPVQGEISSNVSGIIAAMHEPIYLTIKSPTKETEPPTKEGPDAYQEIGDKPVSDAREISLLQGKLITNSRKLNNITEQLTQLNQQLMRLNQNEGGRANELITAAVKRRKSLEESKKFPEGKLRIFRETRPTPDILRVRAVHRDITIKLEDPDVRIDVMRGREEPDIKGVTPENPKRIIELYLTHGIAHIEYPPRLQSK